MVRGVCALLGGTWSRALAKKCQTRRYSMWLLFPAGKAVRVVQGMCSQSHHTGKQLEQSCLRGAAESGLWQHPERRLGQGWASTGRWMPSRASAKCVGLSKGRSSCRKSLGRKDRTNQPQSRQKARGRRAGSRRKTGRSGRAQENKERESVQQAAGMLSLRGCTSLLLRRADPTAPGTPSRLWWAHGENQSPCAEI